MPARLTHPDQLKELLGIPFTPEQTACITAPPAPQVIVAGAGSGKTTVMAARVVWLVGTGQVAPEQVLGLTFTNKAAGELAERVRAALIKAGITDPETLDPDDPPGEPVISTYHAFAGRLLTDHGLRIGIEPTVRLLADATRFQLAARTLREAPGPYPNLTRSFADLVSDLLALDSELAEHLVQPGALRAYDRELLRELEGAKLSNAELRKVPEAAAARLELAELVGRYREAKRAKDVLDFGDQIALSATLADTRPEVGAILRDEFRVVLLDEYQDTSVAQRILLSGLFGAGTGHPVTAVGDPCQAIYGWRGASVANLDDFPEHFAYADGRPAARFSLSENRRSGGRLLDLANTLAEPLRELHAGVEALRPAPGAERDGVVRIALTQTHAQEIDWLADSVAHLVRTGKEPKDIAVLCRTAGDFAEIQGALVARDIPVEVVGLSGLLHLPEVADLVAVCEVLQDPGANASLVRLLTGPRWRIGPRDLALLGRRARMLVHHAQDPDDDDADARLAAAVEGIDPAEVISLADALDTFLEPADSADTDLPFSPDARVRFARLATELRELRRSLADPLMDVLHRVLAVTGLDVELSASPHALAARRRETLSNFLDIAASFAANDPSASLLAFLAFLRTAAQYEKGLDNALPGGENTVKVLTAHKSKGLEWDVVVVPGLVTGTFPSGQGREKWTAQAKVLPHALRGDAVTLPEVGDWDSRGLKAFQEDMKDHQRTEELRLGYVTFTRPRSLLLGSGHWWGPTQKKKRGPSDFLQALYEHCAAGHGEIEVWADEPADDAENPALAEASAEHAWPLPLDDESLARRRAAAATVLAHLDALRNAQPSHGHDDPHPSASVAAVPSDEAHEDAYDPEWPPEPEDAEELYEELYAEDEEVFGADEEPADWDSLPHQRPDAAPSRTQDAHPADRAAGDTRPADRARGVGEQAREPRPADRTHDVRPIPVPTYVRPTPVPRARTPRTPEDLRTVASWDRDLEALATELQRSRRASHDVPLPASLSASQVLRLSTDPDGLARELARPMPRPPAPSARRGTRFHAWVESRFEALELPLLDPDELPGGDAEIADEHDLATLKDAFERTAYAHRTPYAIEAPFQLAIAGRVIRGRIDAVYRTRTTEGTTYEIVDWKTGHGGTADPLQLAIYRLAWAEQQDVPLDKVTASFVFVRTGKITTPEHLPTREHLERLLTFSPCGD
ncbi:UvrD-helicase domain-containing protein [Streptomyces sp. TRM66268-LWL]|uniref:DNA 3'-5' helicase n=1 Tax=Streptomyces polyasparticus TaxID=2767826 RepID=A0ABR7S9Z0_9ACTN|nr:UvrD-helicase domain-containing protein [Streptomyces polyasparticus]MBC9711158.1 UvrD-helicase domain-containing protein [Streptomyces polyasparticus]